MKQKISKANGLTRGRKVFLILMLVAGIIGTLLYFEQVALIYVLATLALVVLLSVVALADLEKVGLEEFQPKESAKLPSSSTPKQTVNRVTANTSSQD